METDVYFEYGCYYHSPKALATTLNGDKPGRVKFSYEPVTQKFVRRAYEERDKVHIVRRSARHTPVRRWVERQ